MDYMKRNYAIWVFGAVLLFGMNNGQAASFKHEEEELRSMLDTVLKQNSGLTLQNKRLSLQNKRLQQVWFGMQQMCKALSMPTCDCGDDQSQQQNNISMTTSPPTTSSSAAPPTQFPERKFTSLKVLSVKSGGINVDPTPITVTYVATPNHTIYWLSYKEINGSFTSAGQRVRSMYDPNVYSSTINVNDLGNFSDLYFWLNNDNESLSMRLNLTELETKQERDVNTPDVGLLQINSTFVSPRNTDLTIFGIVPIEYNDTDLFQVAFTSINTSTNPPVMFESLYGFQQSECLDMVILNHTSTTLILNLTIKYPCAQFGGLVTVTMNYRDFKSTVWTEMSYGPIIKIYYPNGNEIIPSKTMGIYPLPSETIIISPSLGIQCYALGNPKPNVTVWKIRKDDSQKEMTTEILVSENYMVGVLMKKQFITPANAEGKYICRASNGFETIDTSTDVIALEETVFDESKTGVTKNTSESIVISCKAKGKPKPRLELRLYTEYGPDLTTTGMYKVRRYDSKKHSSRITLTISANDTDIHQVYCFSKQGEPDVSFGYSRVIDVFPSVERKNWEFYYNLTHTEGQSG